MGIANPGTVVNVQIILLATEYASVIGGANDSKTGKLYKRIWVAFHQENQSLTFILNVIRSSSS